MNQQKCKCNECVIFTKEKFDYIRPTQDREIDIKSGVILYDNTNLLLIYGLSGWGFPKGSVETSNIKKEALRELKEETGIVLEEQSINDSDYVKVYKTTLFYATIVPNLQDVKKHINKTDEIAGFAWIKPQCIFYLPRIHSIEKLYSTLLIEWLLRQLYTFFPLLNMNTLELCKLCMLKYNKCKDKLVCGPSYDLRIFNAINSLEKNEDYLDYYDMTLSQSLKFIDNAIIYGDILRNEDVVNDIIKIATYPLKNLGLYVENIRTFHNYIKKILIQKFLSGKTILDIGSGKGGDLKKYMDANINKLYALEPNQEYIKEFTNRLKKLPVNFQNRVKSIHTPLEEFKQDPINDINCITSFFSMSFFFENMEKLEILTDFIASNLKNKPDYIFVGTTIDGESVLRLLSGKKAIELGDVTIQKEYDTEELKIGQKIIFRYKGSATVNDEQIEYLVDWPLFVKMLNEKGIQLSTTKLFEPPETLTSSKQIVSKLYRYFIFSKKNVSLNITSKPKYFLLQKLLNQCMSIKSTNKTAKIAKQRISTIIFELKNIIREYTPVLYPEISKIHLYNNSYFNIKERGFLLSQISFISNIKKSNKNPLLILYKLSPKNTLINSNLLTYFFKDIVVLNVKDYSSTNVSKIKTYDKAVISDDRKFIISLAEKYNIYKCLLYTNLDEDFEFFEGKQYFIPYCIDNILCIETNKKNKVKYEKSNVLEYFELYKSREFTTRYLYTGYYDTIAEYEILSEYKNIFGGDCLTLSNYIDSNIKTNVRINQVAQESYVKFSYIKMFETNRFVGNMPHRLERNDLEIINKDYAVTSKLDGIRCFAIIDKDLHNIIYVGRNMQFEYGPSIKGKVDLEFTVLDCELYKGIFHVFDMLYFNGISVMHLNLEDRLEYRFEIDGIITSKKFYFENIFNKAIEFWNSSSLKGDYVYDGMIFSPKNSNYTDSKHFKWKDTFTVDMLYDNGSWYARDGKNLVKMDIGQISSNNIVLQNKNIYEIDIGKNIVMYQRKDRDEPNAIKTIEGEIKAKNENLKLNRLQIFD